VLVLILATTREKQMSRGMSIRLIACNAIASTQCPPKRFLPKADSLVEGFRALNPHHKVAQWILLTPLESGQTCPKATPGKTNQKPITVCILLLCSFSSSSSSFQYAF